MIYSGTKNRKCQEMDRKTEKLSILWINLWLRTNKSLGLQSLHESRCQPSLYKMPVLLCKSLLSISEHWRIIFNSRHTQNNVMILERLSEIKTWKELSVFLSVQRSFIHLIEMFKSMKRFINKTEIVFSDRALKNECNLRSLAKGEVM